MRWNCPHCEEQVTAEIDFTSMKEAYVQCEPCGGMSILHRGAMTTKTVVKTITKTVLVTPPPAPTPVVTQTVTPPPAPIQAAAPEVEIITAPEITLEAVAATETVSEAVAAPEAPAAVPPPFRAPRTEASSYPKPPAFLLKPTAGTQKPLETIETFVEPPRTAGKSMFSNIAVWFAVMTATASGVYLYTQVKSAQLGGVKQIFAAVTRR